jgi:hypothetical protein
MIEAAIVARKDRTVREALDELGVGLILDFDSLATATWPMVRAALGAPAVRAWIEGLVSEFYDAEIAAANGEKA